MIDYIDRGDRSASDLLEHLAFLNPWAILYEPRSAFDQGVVGLAKGPDDQWDRPETPWVVVYDEDKVVAALLAAEWPDGNHSDEDERMVREHVEFNSMGGYHGPHTPTWAGDRHDE